MARLTGSALAACLSLLMIQAANAVSLYAAGSLKGALGEVAAAYQARYGVSVEATFAPSGLLRKRIEAGEPAQVYASANLRHPLALEAAGKGGPVVLFARNRLCAIARPGVEVGPDTLLDRLLDPGIRVGTSTPKADPAGDYAWELFRKAEAVRPGSYATLDAKALKLTGGPHTAKPPAGRNPYGWVMGEQRADLFLTYCTNGVAAAREVPDLQVVELPDALSVGADYGLTVLAPGSPEAVRLALYILSPEGQAVLRHHGFHAAGVPAPE